MLVLYFFVLAIVVGAICIIISEIRYKKKEYFIHRKSTRFYLYKRLKNGTCEQIEDFIAEPNGTEGCFDFFGVHYVYKDVEMAKESLRWHKKVNLKYKGYNITHVIKDGLLAFRFKGDGFETKYYNVYPSVELCKEAIEELIERKVKDNEQYKKENEVIYL